MGPKGWHLHDHFIEDTASRPNVTSVVIWHVFPDLGASVVWGARLSAHHSTFVDARHIHVAKFHNAVLGQEHVRTLDVTMADLEIMESFETSNDLNEEVPDLLLRKV